MIKAVIIDDLDQARENLKNDLTQFCPEVQIIGEANSVVTGVKLVQSMQPEMVFLDVSLGDGTGFDILEIIGQENLKVIFTTASGSHAVKAFRFSAIDYLLKPIDPEELIEAIHKVEQTTTTQIDTLKENLDQTQKIIVNTTDQIHALKVDDIVRCNSQVNYTQFILSNGQKIMVAKTLKEYDQLLSESGFIRTHQSHLVNKAFIQTYLKNKSAVRLENGDEIPVSTRKKAYVLKTLEA